MVDVYRKTKLPGLPKLHVWREKHKHGAGRVYFSESMQQLPLLKAGANVLLHPLQDSHNTLQSPLRTLQDPYNTSQGPLTSLGGSIQHFPRVTHPFAISTALRIVLYSALQKIHLVAHSVDPLVFFK